VKASGQQQVEIQKQQLQRTGQMRKIVVVGDGGGGDCGWWLDGG
jgi:hypothetical protein